MTENSPEYKDQILFGEGMPTAGLPLHFNNMDKSRQNVINYNGRISSELINYDLSANSHSYPHNSRMHQGATTNEDLMYSSQTNSQNVALPKGAHPPGAKLGGKQPTQKSLESFLTSNKEATPLNLQSPIEDVTFSFKAPEAQVPGSSSQPAK